MVEHSDSWTQLTYHSGFGNHVESEAEQGALPKGQNAPQVCPMGLYAEQLSGTPFTFNKNKNQRTWTYRILPTVKHDDWSEAPEQTPNWISDFDDHSKEFVVTPNQLRWQGENEVLNVTFP